MREAGRQSLNEWIGMGIAISALAGHAYAYYYWPEMTIKNVYYLSMYATLYMCGFAFTMITQTTFGKVASGLIMTTAGYLLFIEFAGDPTNWELWEFWLGILVILQGALIVLIFEKIKKK
jgi:hypothetical protein